MAQSKPELRDLLSGLTILNRPQYEHLRKIVRGLIEKLTVTALESNDFNLTDVMGDLWTVLSILNNLESETVRAVNTLSDTLAVKRLSASLERRASPTEAATSDDTTDRRPADIRAGDINKLEDVVLSPRMLVALAQAGINTLEEFDAYAQDKTAEQIENDIHVSPRPVKGSLERLNRWRRYQRRLARSAT